MMLNILNFISETLDEEEFGQNSTSTTFDESLIDPTDELELLVCNFH